MTALDNGPPCDCEPPIHELYRDGGDPYFDSPSNPMAGDYDPQPDPTFQQRRRERIYELALWAMVIVLVAIGVSLLAFTASQLAQLFWNLL